MFFQEIFNRSLGVFTVWACPVLVSHRMAANIDFAVESPAANLAGERFYPRMASHVGQHVRGLTENFPTLLTLEWFDSRVHQGVLLHVGLAKKIFSTISARVGFEVGVNKFVRGET